MQSFAHISYRGTAVTEVVDRPEFNNPISRMSALSASRDGSWASVINFGTVGAMIGAIALSRTANKFDFSHNGTDFDVAVKNDSARGGVVLRFFKREGRGACNEREKVKRG